jgi:hypothetical protein
MRELKTLVLSLGLWSTLIAAPYIALSARPAYAVVWCPTWSFDKNPDADEIKGSGFVSTPSFFTGNFTADQVATFEIHNSNFLGLAISSATFNHAGFSCNANSALEGPGQSLYQNSAVFGTGPFGMDGGAQFDSDAISVTWRLWSNK